MFEIIKQLASINTDGARSGLKRTGMLGVTIHQTGNPSPGANALSHAKYLQGGGANTQASWHYCVDDARATQSIPEDESAWHAGDGYYGKGNRQTIAIEICINEDGNMTKACDNAAELAADILKRYDLSVENLYQHHDWSGKNCPAQIRAGQPYDWNTFKSKVAAHLKQPLPAPQPAVSLDDVARAVIRGDYGNGENRRRALVNAGYDAGAVQARVNVLLGASSQPALQPMVSLDDIARAVIRGDYGNGTERRQALTNAGYDYDAVQARVNQLLR